MASITLNSVSVDFPIYNLNARSIKKQFFRLGSGGKLTETANTVTVKALDDISLTLSHGDRVGLIGHNGAGKSTLLRVLAQIYEPTTGEIDVQGKISPLLDIMFGMDNESTGYENIMMRGILLGLNRKQILTKMNDIAQFTGLGEYLSMPIRTYSTGMRVRLAFAVATSIEPEILILDEVVGAGDSAFIKKAKKKMQDLITQSSIVVLASHSEEIISDICNKVILLDSGKLRFFGPTRQGIQMYHKIN